MFVPCGCASAKTKKDNSQTNRFTLETKRRVEGKQAYRFSPDEFLQFNQRYVISNTIVFLNFHHFLCCRFMEYANGKCLSRYNYKESLGIFGIDSLSFLSDRMFDIMGPDADDCITLEKYLDYFDVMLHGTS